MYVLLKYFSMYLLGNNVINLAFHFCMNKFTFIVATMQDKYNTV